MCGIVGFFAKSGEQAETGAAILGMLRALGCRGPDSTGVALFGGPSDGKVVVRVKLGDDGDLKIEARRLAEHLAAWGGCTDFSSNGAYGRFLTRGDADLDALASSIESLDKDFEVVSIGRRLEIVKQTGSPENLEKAYCVSQFKGSHGLGHTRLSTESRVDLSHSQPFWSHGFPDLAIVHNGHITNYHQLRRRYQQRGVRFYTENDSEVVAIYLAEQLRGGSTLQQALERMLRDLDGSYSCLAATDRELGFVKDAFALKPLVMTETEDFVAVATEEIALRSALAGSYSVREAQVKEVRVWRRR